MKGWVGTMLGMMAGCAGTHTILARTHRQVLWLLNARFCGS